MVLPGRAHAEAHRLLGATRTSSGRIVHLVPSARLVALRLIDIMLFSGATEASSNRPRGARRTTAPVAKAPYQPEKSWDSKRRWLGMEGIVSHIFSTPTLWLTSAAEPTGRIVRSFLSALHHDKYSPVLTWSVNSDNRGFAHLVGACTTGDITETNRSNGLFLRDSAVHLICADCSSAKARGFLLTGVRGRRASACAGASIK